jgi:ArsR family transcriptional regulator, arsenate/arsenite/antimonite-responsive transcriptional repressor / arsenate reductase (thioredoxin)
MAMASSPEVLSVLAHDLRWTIVRLLVPGDLRTSELVSGTGQAPSLVSYHLARLRDAGLVSARRSTADGRDSYHVLDLDALGRAVAGMAARIHPALIGPGPRPAAADRAASRPADHAADPPRPGGGSPAPVPVLFICSGNSARSPMAAGWLNHLGAGRVTARSAGVTPRPLQPLAVGAMAEHGVDISGHQAARVDALAGHRFTRVITLCDRARENCGELPAAPAAAHWSVPDPARAHPPDLDAFRAVARELHTRVRYLLPLIVS